MKLLKAYCTCSGCSETFDLYMEAPQAYGEFLLWSADGQSRYLNAIDDPIYKEVGGLITEVDGDSPGSHSRAEKLQMIFGEVACDPTAEGQSFSMRLLPLCPGCGKRRLELQRFAEPPEVVDAPVDVVTHVVWNQLSYDARRRAVLSAIRLRI